MRGDGKNYFRIRLLAILLMVSMFSGVIGSYIRASEDEEVETVAMADDEMDITDMEQPDETTPPELQETEEVETPDETVPPEVENSEEIETPDEAEHPEEIEMPDGAEYPDEVENPDEIENPDEVESPDEVETPGTKTPEETEIPDETEESGEITEQKKAEKEKVPAIVQAFLDAVGKVPADINADNYEKAGELINAALDAYESVVNAGLENYDGVAETLKILETACAALESVRENELDGEKAMTFASGYVPVTNVTINPNMKPTGATADGKVRQSGEHLTMKIGQRASFLLGAPNMTLACPRCGYVFAVYNPSDYCNISLIDNSGQNIVGNPTYAAGTNDGERVFDTVFEALRPGTSSDVRVCYHANFGIVFTNGASQITVACDRCGGATTIRKNTTWYRYNDVFGITVNADYAINYDTQGGSPVPSTGKSVPASETVLNITEAIPVKTGYTFKGWATSADSTNAVYKGGDSITLKLGIDEGNGREDDPVRKTLYAVWEPTKSYTVIYTDGAPGIVFSDEGYEDLKEGDATPEFTGTTEREGFTFMGWAPAVNPIVSGDDANENGEIIYTATWEKEEKPDDKHKLISITKVRLTEIPEGLSIPAGVTINMDHPVRLGTDETAVLLYRITVVGEEGAAYQVNDENADYVGGDHLSGKIPVSGKAEIYVIKSFSQSDIDSGNLTNKATLTGNDKDTIGPEPGNGEDSSDVPVDKTHKLTGITKVRLTEIPAGVTIPANVAVNKENPVKLGTGESATLLYRITVTGEAGAAYIVNDRVNGKTATHVGGAPMEGTISESGKAEIYVIMSFSQSEIENGKLTNTATVTGNGDNTTNPEPGKEEGGSETPSNKTYHVNINFKTDEGEEIKAPVQDTYDEDDEYNYPVTGKPNIRSMFSTLMQRDGSAIPWFIMTEDGKTYVIDTVLTSQEDLAKIESGTITEDITVDIYYALDMIGANPDGSGSDGIPDKYQAVVTYRAVNGTVVGANAEGERKVVVALKDTNGSYAKAENGGKAVLMESQIPETTPNKGFGPEGAWEPEKPVPGTEIVANITFVITYDPSYTVTYTDGVAGEEVFADQVTSGLKAGDDTPAFAGTPDRKGYTFNGWAPAVAEKVNKDAVYTAQWTKDEMPEEPTYTVTYTDGVLDEEVFKDQITSGLKAGDDTPAFAGTPVREGYTFNGWAPAVAEKVSKDAVYTAQWTKDEIPEEPTYTVTYTDGVLDEEVFKDQITSGLKAGDDTPAFAGTPVREGYTFNGWAPAVAEKVSKDAVYTAQWTKNEIPEEPTYTVIYTDGVLDEEVFKDQITSGLKAGENTPAFAGTPAREGYTFNGWAPAVAEKVSKDAVYTAQWTKNEIPEEPNYTVIYTDGVEGEEVFADQIITGLKAGDNTPAFIGTLVREGYTFKGWAPGIAEKVSGNVVYTAQWAKNSNPTGPILPTGQTRPTTPTQPAQPTESIPAKPAKTTPAQPSTSAQETGTTPAQTQAAAPTPRAAGQTAATPALADVSPEVEVEDDAVPLAQTILNDTDEEETEEPAEPEIEEIKDELVPLAGGDNGSWALLNFVLMILGVFESLMLLIGYFINIKKESEEEEKKLNKKGIVRLISIPIAIVSVVVFCLTEDITLKTAFVDKWTILMAVIAIVQTVVVALSRKKETED